MDGEITMRINTNVSALNSQRILGQTNAAAAKQIGRLSSGFRINRAADDAAGLGIANKLRADIRSMTQASRNAEQANSLLQVAEGATQTIQNIVERMKELATQSASDNVNADSRALIQAEFSQLQSEVTRIVDTTKFQGDFLLKSVDAAVATVGTPEVTAGIAGTGTVSVSGTYTGTADATLMVRYTDSTDGFELSTDGGATYNAIGDHAGLSFTTSAGDASDGTVWSIAVTAAVEASGGARDFLVSSSGSYATADTVQLGALNLELSTLGLAGSTLATKDGAQAALTALDSAISTVSTSFGTIGAAQNRLEYATANVKASIENFAAAESTIRDADMAAEMTEFSRVQILQQAGVAMLAQANQAPQSVLQLLR
jgi:flagellin